MFEVCCWRVVRSKILQYPVESATTVVEYTAIMMVIAVCTVSATVCAAGSGTGTERAVKVVSRIIVSEFE